jgi:hypothetical protein
LGLEYDAVVDFHEPISCRLEVLYQRCLGDEWQASAFSLSKTRAIRSTDFLVSLVGAAIYDQVLSIVPSWLSKGLMIYRAQYHQYEIERYLQEQSGKTTTEKALFYIG